MFLIRVQFVEGVFTGPQKRELISRLTDALLGAAGEDMRQATWCVLEEIPGDRWGIGGETVALDDVRALARAAEAEG
jgi:4-oxalocrotonate tautomerase